MIGNFINLDEEELEELVENFFNRVDQDELAKNERKEKCKCNIVDIWNFGNDGHKKNCPEKKK